MKDIAIFGAGGFGRELACIIQQINKEKPTWNLVGFFDDGIEAGTELQYGKALGGVDILNKWEKPISVAIALGSPKVLRTVVGKITNPRVDFPNIVAPNVFFMDEYSVQMGKGNVICPNSLISCNVKMGDFNMLNVYTQMGHESELGNYNVVMPSTNISGGVIIGEANLFGVKSTVLQYKKVGNNTNIGACSVILKDTEDNATYYGNPARVISRNEPDGGGNLG